MKQVTCGAPYLPEGFHAVSLGMTDLWYPQMTVLQLTSQTMKLPKIFSATDICVRVRGPRSPADKRRRGVNTAQHMYTVFFFITGSGEPKVWDKLARNRQGRFCAGGN